MSAETCPRVVPDSSSARRSHNFSCGLVLPFIAKFSAINDLYSVVKAEFIAMRLARHVGLDVALVELQQALGRDVLLVERFDRQHTATGWTRRGVVSALTLFGLDETEVRYASYEELATLIRHRFADPAGTQRELYNRLVFNILCGNTDDHARNHAAFWDGKRLMLTPAYDICPQGRTGGEASQAMLIVGNKRVSRLAVCLEAAAQFHMTQDQARELISHQVATIKAAWPDVCNGAGLSEVERAYLWGRAFLNPFAFEGLPDAFVSPN
jgi:serine/threonine-protein kinase HipA